jgi:CheY-like chemotaxis protein
MLSLSSTDRMPRHKRHEGALTKKLIAPRVLLVEEDRTVRALLAVSLQALGCRIVTAGNGEEALRVLHARPSVDVVVTAAALPVMAGLELLCAIRQTDGLEQLPVILCAASIDETMMKKAVGCGCGRYLLKPIHPEFLFEQIRSLLQQKASRQGFT